MRNERQINRLIVWLTLMLWTMATIAAVATIAYVWR